LKIKKLVDRMIVLFPFEKNIYNKYGMKVDYVGHPLVDEIVVDRNQTEVLKSIGLSTSKTTIGLMPGSRAKEVERHLPCMLEAAQKLYEQNRERQFILLKSLTIPLELIEDGLSSYKHLPLKIYDGHTYDGINAMDAVIVASGTATLECALLKKPMVIIYKTSWITYAIAKALIKIPYIGLVNVVAGKKVAEELIQNDATAARIANALEAALHDHQVIDELAAVKTSLGEPGASLRAARVILSVIASPIF
jgi:lipid-A-disaccharide synthase